MIAKDRLFPVAGKSREIVASSIELALKHKLDDMLYNVFSGVGWDAAWSYFTPNACCVVEKLAVRPPLAFDDRLCSSCLESPTDCDCPYEKPMWYSAVADYTRIDILEQGVVAFDDLQKLHYRSADDGLMELENEIRYSLEDAISKTIDALYEKGKTW